jgi:hypothetical protein
MSVPRSLTRRVGDVALTLDPRTLAARGLAFGAEKLFATPAGLSLWELTVVDAEGHRAWLSAASARERRVRRQGQALILQWLDARDPDTGAGPFEVTVTARPAGRAGGIVWRIAVRNRSRTFTLWQVIFPQLGGFSAGPRPDADALYYPEGWGMRAAGWEAMPRLDRWSPRGWDFTMPWLAYTRGGRAFYIGAHDPRQAPKQFHFHPGPDRRARFAITLYPADMTIAGNSYETDFDIVTAGIPGGWHEAAGLYAAWARRQPWANRASGQRALSRRRAGSADPPPALAIQAWHKIHLGKCSFIGAPAPQELDRAMDELAAKTEDLARRLGVGLGVHLYSWHRVPFDTSYPDYFPPKRRLKAFIARLRRAGYTVMPYINARLWDINAPSWPRRNAARHAAKDSAMRVNPRTLVPYIEEYGNGQKLAPMCPATRLWQDTVVNLCDRIVHELGAGGVYMDQVAAERALLCFDRRHGHRPGGGGFWLDAYRAMMRRIRRTVGPEAILTTECNWDGCAADFDGLLTWHAYGPRQVPLFAAVYGGLATCFGCNFSEEHVTRDGGEAFARRMAMLFAWGAQLGWGDLTLLLDPSRSALLDFFAQLCRLRAEHGAVFAAGRFLCPPAIGRDGRAGEPADVTRAPVIASVWAAPGGRRAHVFAVNPTRTAFRGTLRVTARECAGWAVRAGDRGGAKGHTRTGAPAVEMSLPPLSARVVTLVPPGL